MCSRFTKLNDCRTPAARTHCWLGPFVALMIEFTRFALCMIRTNGRKQILVSYGVETMTAYSDALTRRQLLKSGAALAAGGALPKWFVEETAAHAAVEEPKSPN